MPISPQTKKLLNTRLAKAVGHLASVQKMVDSDIHDLDILSQLKGVQSALDRIAQMILREHLRTSTFEENRDSERVLAELWKALKSEIAVETSD